MNKTSLRDAILRKLGEELARQTRAAELAHDEATSEESQPENKWDTHSQEAAYLAEGQARLVIEIGQSIELYQTLTLPNFAAGDPVAIGALVSLEGREGTSRYFIGPRAGGLELDGDGGQVMVITPQSPLGRQLVGRREGETVPTAGSSSGAPRRIARVE